MVNTERTEGNERKKKRENWQEFQPHIITYKGNAFRLQIALTGLDLIPAGRADFPKGERGPQQLFRDVPQVLNQYKEGHYKETTRSLEHAGITAGKRTGNKRNKDMLRARRKRTIEIIRAYEQSQPEFIAIQQMDISKRKERKLMQPLRQRKLPDEVIAQIRQASDEIITPEMRRLYMEAAVASKKYGLRGTRKTGEVTFGYNKRKEKVSARVKTATRSYQGYRFHSNPEEARRLAEEIASLRITSGEENEENREKLTQQFTEQILDLGDIMGNASSVVTSDGKRCFVVRSWANGSYRWDPGAPIAGLSDQQVDTVKRKPGQHRKGIRPVGKRTIKKNTFQESKDELGIPQDKIDSYEITGIVDDLIKKHSEVVGEMRVSLTEAELTDTILENAKIFQKDKLYEFAEGNFFFIPDTPESLETLLTKVSCPFPPTHAGGEIINAGRKKYQELLTQYNGDVKWAFEEAEIWVKNLAAATDANYDRMNQQAAAYWRANDNANWKAFIEEAKQLPENDPHNAAWDPAHPPEGYEPRILPERQGLKSVFEGLREYGLITEEQAQRTVLPRPDQPTMVYQKSA